MPGRVGMIAGIFFGFAFGVGGIAAAVLGAVADVSGIEYVFLVCSFLPLLGLLTVFLPDMRAPRTWRPDISAPFGIETPGKNAARFRLRSRPQGSTIDQMRRGGLR